MVRVYNNKNVFISSKLIIETIIKSPLTITRSFKSVMTTIIDD